jgi:hypothetical protein
LPRDPGAVSAVGLLLARLCDDAAPPAHPRTLDEYVLYSFLGGGLARSKERWYKLGSAASSLKGNWLKLSRWAEAYEQEHGGVVCTRRQEANQLRDAIDKRDAGAVIELLTQQRATFTERDVERTLSKQIKDRDERAVFAGELFARPEVVGLAEAKDGPVTRYTTASVLEAEQTVLAAAGRLAKSTRHEVDDLIRAGAGVEAV